MLMRLKDSWLGQTVAGSYYKLITLPILLKMKADRIAYRADRMEEYYLNRGTLADGLTALAGFAGSLVGGTSAILSPAIIGLTLDKLMSIDNNPLKAILGAAFILVTCLPLLRPWKGSDYTPIEIATKVGSFAAMKAVEHLRR